MSVQMRFIFNGLALFLLLLSCHYRTVNSDKDVASNDILKAILQKSSGIYKDTTRQVGLERTVLVTGCNHGFLNHLHNFKCFADRLGLKFLVVALDEKSNQYLTKHTDMDTYYMSTGSNNLSAPIESDVATFRSNQFNLITARKKEVVHDILALGYDVVFSDTDVAIINDPMPYLLWKNVDYVHSLNTPCMRDHSWDFRTSKVEGNTGLYFVRSNVRTIKLWTDAFEAVPKHPGLDDQAVFWKVIRRSTDPPVYPMKSCQHLDKIPQIKGNSKDVRVLYSKALTTCYLDVCLFSSGMLSNLYVPEYTYDTLMEILHARNQSIVTLHANYLKGNTRKALRMMDYGLWLAKGDENGMKSSHDRKHVCTAYVPVKANITMNKVG